MISTKRFNYYVKNVLSGLIPNAFWRGQLQGIIDEYEQLSERDKRNIDLRVNYYNKIVHGFSPSKKSFSVGSFRKSKPSAYYYDTKRFIRYFQPDYRFDYLAGDIISVPETPTLLKSRPIVDNDNSILLNMDEIRHFVFVDDNTSLEQKIPKVVWRGAAHPPQTNRVDLVKRYHNSKYCNIGQSNPAVDEPWHKGFMSIKEQLKYKYILSIEGNDVATNLKWIMSSNSVAVMCPPTYETWFMEGSLEADKHYIGVDKSYSDLEDKLFYYESNPEKLIKIVSRAKAHSASFRNSKTERMVSLLVLLKYFNYITVLDY